MVEDVWAWTGAISPIQPACLIAAPEKIGEAGLSEGKASGEIHGHTEGFTGNGGHALSSLREQR